ncbi:MAG: hypothetical protein H6707_19460, partial [Deltaproteobacteria bacterium]|nr:hypothetical protein [Deltaproteobacteria bacterium]
MTALTHIVATLALLFGLFCSRADAYVLKTCGDKPVVWPITEIDIVVDLSSAPASLIDQLPGGSIAAKDDDDKDGKSSSDD